MQVQCFESYIQTRSSLPVFKPLYTSTGTVDMPLGLRGLLNPSSLYKCATLFRFVVRSPSPRLVQTSGGPTDTPSDEN
ncbi:hypothetical protein RSAG8_11690, partial [Rhizoctonia solani AG-8 WAC10335]